MRSKCTRLPEHGVNKRSFSMVNVGDDCNITKLIARFNWQISQMFTHIYGSNAAGPSSW
jgi:hypothetical protein